VCNQGCYFCPVAYDPREAYFMPTEQYEEIVDQLAAHRDTIEAVFMINYNEPTADKRFVDQVRALKEAGLPPATLTNGTGLTPKRVDELVAMGGLRFLSINLSTLDRERYAATGRATTSSSCCATSTTPGTCRSPRRWTSSSSARATRSTAPTSRRSAERFAGSRFNVKFFEVMDRAGYLQIGLSTRNKTLCGCDNIGSRPLQHLHITRTASASSAARTTTRTTWSATSPRRRGGGADRPRLIALTACGAGSTGWRRLPPADATSSAAPPSCVFARTEWLVVDNGSDAPAARGSRAWGSGGSTPAATSATPPPSTSASPGPRGSASWCSTRT
jgi:hypothetical protein